MRPLIRTLVLAGALGLAIASPAHADAPTAAEQQAGQRLQKAYFNTGQIDACRYSVEELELGLAYANSADVRQYSSDFPAAIRDAIATHARGDCDAPEPTPSPAPTQAAVAPTAAPPTNSGGGAPTVPSTGAATAAPPQRVVPDPPAPEAVASAAQPSAADPALERAATSSPGNGTPVPLIGLGVLSALALLTVMMLSALRRLGATGGPLEPAYHHWREAQWRAGGVWDDFRDWLRTGR